MAKKIISNALIFLLFFPMMTFAHLISITATRPFPASVKVASRFTAIFTVTNITSRVSLTVIDKSQFPQDSGLSIVSSTCGRLLAPGQSCTIQLQLQPSVPQTIETFLKEWAKPSADGVQYPINIQVTSSRLPNITLVPINSNGLPALRDPIVATNSNNWLILSGSLGGFHDFNNNFNPNIYVYNPLTSQIFSLPISSTNLPVAVKNQLSSSDVQFLQDGDTLYIIGGFYTPDNINFTTINTLTAINIPGIINAVINNDNNLAPFVSFNTSIPQFKVTGGQLGKIGNYFYLAYGQECEGNYCGTLQVYTNSVYKFITDPTLASTLIVDTATHPDLDGSGWRRRDYSLLPFQIGNTPTLFAMGGPFTPGQNALVWTNGIHLFENLQTNNNFINQQANQYLTGHLTMFSANTNITYAATFSGLSNLFWTSNGLSQDSTTPYGNILDLITADASGNTQEYANIQPLCSGQPVSSCLYMGLAASFIPGPNYFDSRDILQLDQLPQHTPTLVGYLYAGLLSQSQNIFVTPDPTYPTNQIYAVYVTPIGSGATSWVNITNLYPGN